MATCSAVVAGSDKPFVPSTAIFIAIFFAMLVDAKLYAIFILFAVKYLTLFLHHLF